MDRTVAALAEAALIDQDDGSTKSLLARAGVRVPALSSALQKALDGWYARASRSARGEWAIAVASQDGQVLWSHDPDHPMIPASTVKIFTTGFARSVLGSDARRRP